MYMFLFCILAFTTMVWQRETTRAKDSMMNHSVGNLCAFARKMLATGGPWVTKSEMEEAGLGDGTEEIEVENEREVNMNNENNDEENDEEENDDVELDVGR